MTIRYTNIDFDNITRLSDLRQLTYGISKYVVGHKLKIQADLSFSRANENKNKEKIEISTDGISVNNEK